MVVIIELYDVYYRFWFLYYSNFIKNDYMLYNIFFGIMYFYYIIDMKIIVIIYIIMIIVFVENVIMFYFCYV